MKINQYLLAAFFVIWQVSVFGESEYKHEEHEQHGMHEHSSIDHKRVRVAIAKLQMILAEHELVIAKHEEAIAGHEKNNDAHEKGGSSHDQGDMHATHSKVMKIVEAIEKLPYDSSHGDHAKVNDHVEHKHEDHEQHGTHEHGVAHLTIAVGGTGLDIALETPAVNILGFEHQANSDQDKKTLEEQKTKLETPKALFSINDAAKCKPADTKVISPLFKDHAKHDQESHKEEAHNDIDANWSFKCENSKEIKSISVNLFSAFPKGFKQIKVDWISENSASTETLKKDAVVNLK